MRVVLAVVLFGACWTGTDHAVIESSGEPPRVARARRDVHIVLARTACLGRCPVFELSIWRDGTVEWLGGANVRARGRRTGLASAEELAKIDEAVERARFFERDASGHLPRKPVCVRTARMTTCSLPSFTICSDASRTRISIRRGTEQHQVTNAHCSDEDLALTELERVIEGVSEVRAWIGR